MGTYPATGGKPNFIEFMTPVGALVHSYHDAPQLKTIFNTKTPVLDDQGIQLAEYKVTLAWNKALLDAEVDPQINGAPGLLPMRRLGWQAQCEAWPESLDPAKASWVVLEPFLRDGDNPQHNTERKEYLFGKVYLNIKQKAKPSRDPQTGRITYTGAPGCIDAYGNDILPGDIWAGCTARASGIMWGTEYAGKKFISVRLNNLQKYMDGERLQGGARKSARDQFDPLMQGGPPLAGMPGQGGGVIDPFGRPGAPQPMQGQPGVVGHQYAPQGQFGQPQQFQPMQGGYANQQPFNPHNPMRTV